MEPTAPEKKTKAAARLVLIVDDDRELRDLLREVLEEEGYSVALAKNGADALQQLGDGLLPDVLLVDLAMPDTDGIQFCEQWKSNPRLHLVPLVILSGVGDRHDFNVRCAPTEFLEKPITLDELLETLKRQLG